MSACLCICVQHAMCESDAWSIYSFNQIIIDKVTLINQIIIDKSYTLLARIMKIIAQYYIFTIY